MELKQKLSRLRKDKGLTQLELAERLNVSRQAVSRWEVGAAVPSLDNLMFLSRLYGVPLDDLVQDGPQVLVPLEEALSDPSLPPSPKASRSRTPLVPLLLAALVLGVGILIGISLPRKQNISELDSGEQITVNGPQAWLERTPTDIEDELQWLETTVKDMLDEKQS